ncbi:MAG: SH3 domain-containing protein [Candidatus Promineifilaceae bacterium]
MSLFLKRGWIVILALFLSACLFDRSGSKTPTAENETPSASAEAEKPAVSPSSTRPTTAPTAEGETPSASARPTEEPVPQVKPISNAIYVRSGPGDEFEQVGLLYEDETAVVVGTDAFGSWYQIQTEDGEEGWVAASVVEVTEGEIVIG